MLPLALVPFVSARAERFHGRASPLPSLLLSVSFLAVTFRFSAAVGAGGPGAYQSEELIVVTSQGQKSLVPPAGVSSVTDTPTAAGAAAFPCSRGVCLREEQALRSHLLWISRGVLWKWYHC